MDTTFTLTCARWILPAAIRFWSRSRLRRPNGPQSGTGLVAPARAETGEGIAAKIAATWGCSSAGRASRSQCEGREFDPPQLHHRPVDLTYVLWALPTSLTHAHAPQAP